MRLAIRLPDLVIREPADIFEHLLQPLASRVFLEATGAFCEEMVRESSNYLLSSDLSLAGGRGCGGPTKPFTVSFEGIPQPQ